MTTYVVGDIQGCFEPFQCLLERVDFDPVADVVWSVGDLINRGPDNIKTLRWFYENRDSAVVVLGNHDLHLMAVAAGVRKMSKSDNFGDILEAPDRDKILLWLRHQPLAHHEHGVTMVHAGIPPIWTVEDTLRYAKEVESALQGPDSTTFFEAMYGNEPITWSEDLRGMNRLRVITNYLTRMRYCTKKGKLDLINKGPKPKVDALQGRKVAPWFKHKQRLTASETIIFGHWASLEGVTNCSGAIALDTGCVWGNKMTLLDLETRTFHQCQCK